MKKILSIVIVLVLVFTLIGCDKQPIDPESNAVSLAGGDIKYIDSNEFDGVVEKVETEKVAKEDKEKKEVEKQEIEKQEIEKTDELITFDEFIIEFNKYMQDCMDFEQTINSLGKDFSLRKSDFIDAPSNYDNTKSYYYNNKTTDLLITVNDNDEIVEAMVNGVDLETSVINVNVTFPFEYCVTSAILYSKSDDSSQSEYESISASKPSDEFLFNTGGFEIYFNFEADGSERILLITHHDLID